ncbi:phosphoglycerate kinase [Patescibacteria group bacterium]|nr:phosphoglycerate kinase [Patescibacteria group bacterium]
MIKKIYDLNVGNKRVLVRCDFNVPLDEQGNILDDSRIVKILPTIKYLIKKKAKIILMSHLGNPDGKIVPTLTMDKVQENLVAHLGRPVTKAPDCIGYEIEKYTYGLNPGDIFLLENLRFHKEETENNQEFASFLSRTGEIYINDAFGVCHRAHASVVGVPQYIKEKGVGLLLEKEIRTLEKVMQKPKRPMLAIIGGKKVETKTKLIENILKFADVVIIGELIKQEIEKMGIEFSFKEKLVVPIDAIESDGRKLDIGPETVKLFRKKIKKAKTIFWNGPLGQTEEEEFAKGTLAIAKAITKKWFCFTLVGGGETVEFLTKTKLASKFDYVSTGGGAMLSFLSGEQLVGLQPLIQ